MMENLTQGFKLPCVMDVKIGARCPFSNIFLIFLHMKYLVLCNLVSYSYQISSYIASSSSSKDVGPRLKSREASRSGRKLQVCYFLILVQAVSLLLSCWYKLLLCYFLISLEAVILLLSYTYTSCKFVTLLYFYKLVVVFVTAGLKNLSASPSLGSPCTRERRSR